MVQSKGIELEICTSLLLTSKMRTLTHGSNDDLERVQVLQYLHSEGRLCYLSIAPLNNFLEFYLGARNRKA